MLALSIFTTVCLLKVCFSLDILATAEAIPESDTAAASVGETNGETKVDTIDQLPIAALFNNQFNHLFGNQTLASHIDTILGQFLGKSFNVSSLLTRNGPENLLNRLGGSVGEDNVKVVEEVLRNGQYNLDNATIETISSILSQYDSGALKSIGDVFGKLSRVPSIDPEALSVAENIVSGMLTEKDHEKALNLLKLHVTTSKDERKTVRNSDYDISSSGLGILEPHLNPKLIILLTKLRKDTESLMHIIDILYTSRLKKQPMSSEATQQLSSFYKSVNGLSTLSLTLVNVTSQSLSMAISSVCSSTTNLIQLPISKPNLTKATKRLAAAIRRFLLGCQYKTIKVYQRLEAKQIEPVVVINGIATIAVTIGTLLSVCSQVLSRSANLYASSCAVLPKVSATVEHATNVVYVGLEEFVDEASLAFVSVENPTVASGAKAQRHSIRAMRYILKSMHRIGTIFSF